MKKEDLAAAVNDLRIWLNSDKIVSCSEDYLKQNRPTDGEKFVNSIVGWLVEGKGHYDRLTGIQKQVARQLGLDEIYIEKINSKWVPYWSALQVNTLKNSLASMDSRTFIETHRRVICLHDLLKVNLKTTHSEDEFIAEAITEGDPDIESVETSLQLIRELTKAYCDVFYPDEPVVIRVTYLDMGSNYQVGVKVDAKAEIGSNLTQLLTQILRFATNPRAFINELRIGTLLVKVQAFEEIQRKVKEGTISHEAGEKFAAELFGAAQRLTTHGVFPTELLKEKEETNTVQEFRSLLSEASFQAALPEPKLELPEERASTKKAGADKSD